MVIGSFEMGRNWTGEDISLSSFNSARPNRGLLADLRLTHRPLRGIDVLLGELKGGIDLQRVHELGHRSDEVALVAQLLATLGMQ